VGFAVEAGATLVITQWTRGTMADVAASTINRRIKVPPKSNLASDPRP
jgi:hypothetical protein